MRGLLPGLWFALLLSVTGCASGDLSRGVALDRNGTKSAKLDGPGLVQHSAFYVASHGWHTSIIVPRNAVPNGAWPAGVLDRTFRSCRYVEAGWGDRTFYMAPRPNVATAFDAVFLPGDSVLHVVGQDPPLESAFAWTGLVRMQCTAEQLRNVCRVIGTTFAANTAGGIEALGPGLYGRISRFYPAHGRYYFANTCNNWTARIMRAGGFAADAGPIGTYSAGAVMAQAQRLAKDVDQRGSRRAMRTSGR